MSRPALGKRRHENPSAQVDHFKSIHRRHLTTIGDVSLTARFHSAIPRSFAATTEKKIPQEPVRRSLSRVSPAASDSVSRLIDANKKAAPAPRSGSAQPTSRLERTVSGKSMSLSRGDSFSVNKGLNPMQYSGIDVAERQPSPRPSTPTPRSSASNFFTNDDGPVVVRGRRTPSPSPMLIPPATDRVLVPRPAEVAAPPALPARSHDEPVHRGVRMTITPFVAPALTPRAQSPGANAASARRAEKWRSSILSETPSKPDGSCMEDFSRRANGSGRTLKRGSIIAPPQPSGLAPKTERGRNMYTLLDGPIPAAHGGRRHSSPSHIQPHASGRRVASPARSASCSGAPIGNATREFSPRVCSPSRKNIQTFSLAWE